MAYQTQGMPRVVAVPGLKRPVGLGDVVRKATDAAHIPHCSPCEERQRRLNQFLQFVPRGRS